MPPARSAPHPHAPHPHAPHPHAQQPADRAAIIATAFAFLVTMMGTTIPTPLHSISATELAFSPRTIPVLFAVYALGVVGALLAFGRLSDDLGRRPVLLIAVSFAFGSALLLQLPPSLPLLVAARVVSGLGAGLMSGAGTAAVIDLFPAQRRARGAAVAVAAHSGGLALGTLLAGTLASLAPHPLTLPVAVHLSLCVMAFLALGFWTPAPAHRGPVRIRPQRLRVPRELRGAFARAVLAAGAGFAITGVLTAVTALFLAQHLRLDNHALAGGIVFLAFAGMALGQLLAQRVRAGAAIPAGCAGLVLAAA
ncbi:MFS transporter, partial [Leucobacter sp. M11]|uniref:MFS transporter n=1 Tax=Leucobacter sp. M11 TaxID=2993565 RepID=UPI002D802262